MKVIITEKTEQNSVAIISHLRVLLQQESNVYAPTKNYFALVQEQLQHSKTEGCDGFNERWRYAFSKWFYELADNFRLERDVVAIALDYLDRFSAFRISCYGGPPSKRNFQLTAVTCLYIAVKLHGSTDHPEGRPPGPTIGEFVKLSHKFFGVEDILSMEIRILNSLNWRLHPPTRLRFIEVFHTLCPKWPSNGSACRYIDVMDGIYRMARYLAEISVCDSTFAFTFKNSVVAYACICCSIEALKNHLPIPYDVRVVLFNNIAQLTGIYQELDEVRLACQMLRDLCPSLFEEGPIELSADHTSSSIDINACSGINDSTASAVSVIDSHHS